MHPLFPLDRAQVLLLFQRLKVSVKFVNIVRFCIKIDNRFCIKLMDGWMEIDE